MSEVGKPGRQLTSGTNVPEGQNRVALNETEPVFAQYGEKMIEQDLVELTLSHALEHGGDFAEVFVDIPLEVAEARDPKGLYKKARRGELPNFTGIDSDYEAPEKPEAIVNTAELSVDECAEKLLELIKTDSQAEDIIE